MYCCTCSSCPSTCTMNNELLLHVQGYISLIFHTCTCRCVTYQDLYRSCMLIMTVVYIVVMFVRNSTNYSPRYDLISHYTPSPLLNFIFCPASSIHLCSFSLLVSFTSSYLDSTVFFSYSKSSQTQHTLYNQPIFLH